MIQMVINSTEPLIFRDGRPFGDFGTVAGGVLRWPLPTTIAGMVRTRIGTRRAPDFFWKKDQSEREANVAAILKIGVAWTLPVWRPQDNGEWRYLFPRPADALLLDVPETPNTYTLHRFTLQKGDQTFGHDLPWRNWFLPVTGQRDKPAANPPDLWHQEAFLQWLMQEPMQGLYSHQDLGFSLPALEVRMHTSIAPETGTVRPAQLFSSSGIRLVTTSPEDDGPHDSTPGKFGIAVAINGHEEQDQPFGPCFLGGERRTVFADPLPTPLPSCPSGLANQQYLRLVLITPGDFGAWAPKWLLPPVNTDETPWVTVPGADIKVRLVAAHVPRWQAISGWDYHHRGPKAMRKLTPVGSVYVIEVEAPRRSQELAEHLWCKSISQDLDHPDGYGVVCIGKATLS